MSLSCSKEFTLTINPVASSSAYYKCEELVSMGGGNDKLVDSVSGRDLKYGTETTSTIVPGLIGNGILACNSLSSSNTWVTDTEAFWDFVGGDFTIRFWYKQTALPFYSFKMILGTKHQVSFWTYDSPDQMNVFVDLDVGFVDEYLNVPDANWHRYVVWYKHLTEVGIKMDNNASIVIPTTSEINSTPPSERHIYLSGDRSGVNYVYFDEIGVWKRALSEAELLYDWNGGAGRTYPDVP